MKPSLTTSPHAIIMIGIPGAGKTHFAEHFAKSFQAPYVHIDALIGADIDEKAAHTVSRLMFTELVKTQKTVVFEGPTHDRSYRNELMKFLHTAGYKPLLVWVQTETAEAKRRSTKRGGARTQQQFDDLLQQFHPPAVSEKPIVISGKHTSTSQLKVILQYLSGELKSDSKSPRTPVPRGNVIIR